MSFYFARCKCDPKIFTKDHIRSLSNQESSVRMFTYCDSDSEWAGWVAADFCVNLRLFVFRAKVTLITSLSEFISVFSNRPRLLFFRPLSPPVYHNLVCEWVALLWYIFSFRPLAAVCWSIFSKHSPATVVRDMIAWTYTVWVLWITFSMMMSSARGIIYHLEA